MPSPDHSLRRKSQTFCQAAIGTLEVLRQVVRIFHLYLGSNPSGPPLDIPCALTSCWAGRRQNLCPSEDFFVLSRVRIREGTG